MDEIGTAAEPSIIARAREERAQRLMMAYAVAGLFFMLLPRTFLGVWNMIAISGGRAGSISSAWIQAVEIEPARPPLMEIRFHTPRNVPGSSMKKRPAT